MITIIGKQEEFLFCGETQAGRRGYLRLGWWQSDDLYEVCKIDGCRRLVPSLLSRGGGGGGGGVVSLGGIGEGVGGGGGQCLLRR